MGDEPEAPGDDADKPSDEPVEPAADLGRSGAPARRVMSVGAGIGVGVGLFFLSCLAAFIVVASMLGTSGLGPTYAVIAVFLVPPAVAVGMLFFPRVRRGGTGILIVFAAAWLVVVGPCIAPSLITAPML